METKYQTRNRIADEPVKPAKIVKRSNKETVDYIKATVNDLKTAFHKNDTQAFDMQTKLIEEQLDLISV